MSADGHIRIAIEVDGKQVEVASKDLDGLGKAGQDSGKGVKQAEDGLKGVERESNKASGSVKKFATSLGLIAIGAVAFRTLRNAMDSAISRFDTLNSFPKVLEALGVSAEDAERAMQKLSDGTDGLPTKLDDIASTAQRMYTSFGDMDKASDSAIALNNALLGSGSSAEQASRGTEMYLKVLQTGKVDLQTWRSLSETMDVGLVKIAEGFGYAGKSAKDDLYRALQDGTVTIDQFNDKLIEVGTGTGIMAELARENSLGLATSLTNLQTAVSRNVANVIESFNNLSKEVTGKEIAEHIDGLKNIINSSFKVITRAIEGSAPVVKLFANTVKATIPIVSALSPAIYGAVAAYTAYVAITKGSIAIQSANATITTVATVARKAYTVSVMASTTAIGLMTGAISLSTAAQMVATTATYAFGAAIRFLLGPVGLIITGIGLLTTGVIAAVKWFKRTSKEADRLNKETEKLGDSTKELTDSVDESAKSYEKSQEQIKSNAKTNKELVKQIDELSRKENKSAGDKKLLQSYVEDLNNSVEGLNLVYGEESDALNMTSEQMMKRIELMQEEEKMQASQERLRDVIQEQVDIEKQLEEVNELREEWNEKLEDGSVKSREHKKALEELEEQEIELMDAHTLATEKRLQADEDLTASAEKVAQITEETIGKQMLLYEELSDKNKEIVDEMKASWEDYLEKATDMFDQLSDKADLTYEEMKENMQENQRVISEWADNMAILAEKGVDEGLLEQLRRLGPEGAGEVAVLAKQSESELAELSKIFRSGAELATDTLKTTLGDEASKVFDEVEHLVVGVEKSLRQQVESADFEGAGLDIADGTAEGVEKGTPKVEESAREMAKKTSDAFKAEAEIRSPSKEFERHGINITEGVVSGINDGTQKVIDTAKKLYTSITRQFNGIKSDFYSIGTDAMAGLNQGLNAGSSRVIATARRIANQVHATMQRSLDIRSPSQKARDEVGKEYTAGFALGIADNARLAYDAVKQLSSGIMKVSSPEMALGTARMAQTSAGNVYNNTSRSITETKYNNVNMDGLFNGANFHVRDDQDIPKLAKELNDYIKGGARKHGVIY